MSLTLGPQWVDLMPGVRVLFAPIGPKAVREAREAVRVALLADEDDLIEASDELSRALIRRGIMEWEGVGDPAGKALPVTPEAIELFLGDARAFEAATRLYVTPWTLRDAEGNASAGSPDGTGTKAMPAPDTANSAVPPIATDAASSAPTGSTSPKATKPKRSGKS